MFVYTAVCSSTACGNKIKVNVHTVYNSSIDYLLASRAHQLGIVGSPQCPASYANDGFGASNAFFWLIPETDAFFLCLRGAAREEVAYEVLPNYDSPGFPSGYWNAFRCGRLSPRSQILCRACYPEPGVRAPPPASLPSPSARERDSP